MDRNELIEAEQQVTEQLTKTERVLKEHQESQEEFAQLSKEGQRFFQDILDLLHGSSERHIFQGLYDEQISLDKKVKSDFEREYNDLQHDHRHLIAQSERLATERRKLDKEEMNGR